VRNDRMILRYIGGSAIRIILISNILPHFMEKAKKSVPTIFVISLSFHSPDFFVTWDRQLFHFLSQTNTFRRVCKIAKRDY